jgi:hypothetical protein
MLATTTPGTIGDKLFIVGWSKMPKICTGSSKRAMTTLKARTATVAIGPIILGVELA